ncbi:MAG: glycoside hydrolase family 3 protein [Flavobacteriaceae bacterium]|nr:glycoside hydrolase family 3 protein [Flavobacteriaceae bacterium]
MKKTIFLIFYLLASVFSLGQNLSNKINLNEKNERAKFWVDSTYQSLSTEDRIAQLFIVAAYTNKGIPHTQEVNNLVNQEHIGGLILMQDDAVQQAQWVNQLQSQSKVPLLIGIDGEWGLAQRFTGTAKFPWAMTLGAIADDSLIYQTARQIALYCRRMGIHWDFAPVVDINVNPANPIIGNRSFGSEKENVMKKALAYMRGLQDEHILSSAKHFPGHGDTDTDSHLDLPVLKHSQARFDSLELYPFKQLIASGVNGIMVAHLNVPEFEPDSKVPASLSYNIITKLLKEKLGFKGLIVTDALNMQGVAKNYPYGEMDYLAFRAGNDVLLFSQNVALGKQKIKEEIGKGEISMSRLEESVKKILYAKYWIGLSKKFEPIDTANLMSDLNTQETHELNQKLYAEAITLLKSSKENFPLKKHKKYVYLPLENGDYQAFYSLLKKRFPTLETVKNISELNHYNPKDYELIIGIHKDTETTVYYSYKLSENTKNTIMQLSGKYKVTLCDFISPYSLNDLDLSAVQNIILTYQNNIYTQTSIVNVLDGSREAKGRLPVTIKNKKK